MVRIPHHYRRFVATLGVVGLMTAAMAAQPLVGNAVPSGKEVIIENVPLPVDVTDASLQVGGTVEIGGTPTVGLDPSANTVQLQGTPQVQTALPTNPMFLDFSIFAETQEAQFVDGTFAISAITLTNQSSESLVATVQNALTEGSFCAGEINGGGEPHLEFELGPTETFHADFPTPLVFEPLSGEEDVCVGVLIDNANPSEVRIGITGFRI